MIAKIMAYAEDRPKAIEKLSQALAATRLAGTETNLAYLSHILASDVFRDGLTTTAYLGTLAYSSATVEVLAQGTLSTVHDFPGRLGYWDVGIPPLRSDR